MTSWLARVSDVCGPPSTVWASRSVWTRRGAVAHSCAHHRNGEASSQGELAEDSRPGPANRLLTVSTASCRPGPWRPRARLSSPCR